MCINICANLEKKYLLKAIITITCLNNRNKWPCFLNENVYQWHFDVGTFILNALI